MTIQELIDELEKLPDKDREILVATWESERMGDYLVTKDISSISDSNKASKNPYIYI